MSPAEIFFLALGIAGALTFAAVSMTVNASPTPAGFKGWIAVLEQGRNPSSQIKLSVSPVSPGGSGNNPRLRYSVAVCGPKPFQGALLIGQAARLGDLHVLAPPAPVPGPAPTRDGEPISAIKNLKMMDVSRSSFLAYKGVQVVRLALPAIRCIPQSPTGDEMGFFGTAAAVEGLARAPVASRSQGPFDLWSGPRSTQAWPYVGNLPGIETGDIGEFRFVSGLAPGPWSRPHLAHFEVSVGALTEKATVDFARPTLSSSTALAWNQTEPFAAIARVTNADSLSSWQTYLVLASIALAIGGSLVAAVALRQTRPAGSIRESGESLLIQSRAAPARGSAKRNWMVSAVALSVLYLCRRALGRSFRQ